MLFFKISKGNHEKAFDEKMKSYEFRVEYLCNADSILFCSICYNDAIIKLKKLKDIADEANLEFNYSSRLDNLRSCMLNCFDSALAKEIEKITDDLVSSQDINRFIARLQNLEDDFNSNKKYFSENGITLYNTFMECSNTLIEKYSHFFK